MMTIYDVYKSFRLVLLHNLPVIANVSSGAPKKNVNDVTNHIENQDDCHAEPVEAQTV